MFRNEKASEKYSGEMATFETLFDRFHDCLYENSEEWTLLFEKGHPQLTPLREEMLLIGDREVARCSLCAVPQSGFDVEISNLRETCGIKDFDAAYHEFYTSLGGGKIQLLERKSKRNEHFCNCCDAYIEAFSGGANIELPILVTDVRESTKSLLECNPAQGAIIGLSLRRQVSTIASAQRGFMLQDRGDGYMHVFPYGFAPTDVKDRRQWALSQSIRTAVKLAHEARIPTPQQGTLRLGIGLCHGTTYMGAPAIETLPNRLDLILVLGSATASVAAHLSDVAEKGSTVVANDTLELSGLDPDANGWIVKPFNDAEVPAWKIKYNTDT